MRADAITGAIALMALLFSCGCSDDSDVVRYQTAKAPQEVVPTPVDGAQGVKWEKPGNWFPKQASSMRMASFSIPVDGQVADCSLVKLGGTAGGLAANINRWRGQVGLPPLPPNDAIADLVPIADGKTPFLTLKIENEDRPETAQLVSIFQRQDETLFVKLSAPSEVLPNLGLVFLAFCQTIEFEADGEQGPG